MHSLKERYFQLKTQIAETVEKTGRSSAPTLIAVSKFQSAESIEALYHLGHRDFGENYVQELLEKDQKLKERGLTDIRWHFIGHLQRNKVKVLVPIVDTIHTVDSLSLASEVAKRWKALGTGDKLKIFLEVNLHSETSKAGFEPKNLLQTLQPITYFNELMILGLMCIPDPKEDARQSFTGLRALEHTCHPFTHSQLSMGMSGDYVIAIEEGSTHIRVGTSLFGPRSHQNSSDPTVAVS